MLCSPLLAGCLLASLAGCGERPDSAPARGRYAPPAPKQKPKVAEAEKENYEAVAKETLPDAEAGVPEAQYLLGMMYVNGKGVSTDFVEAYKWLELAAAQGDADAVKARDLVLKLLKPEQIAEGKRRAAAFVPAKNPAEPALQK